MNTNNLIVGLALAQFVFFGVMVGRARGKYGIAAPATTGNEMFERYFRVQMNTMELLVAFVPALYAFSAYYSSSYVALLGTSFLVGRFVFFYSYVKDPKSRGLGFALSMIPVMALIVGTVAGAARGLLQTHGN